MITDKRPQQGVRAAGTTTATPAVAPPPAAAAAAVSAGQQRPGFTVHAGLSKAELQEEDGGGGGGGATCATPCYLVVSPFTSLPVSTGSQKPPAGRLDDRSCSDGGSGHVDDGLVDQENSSELGSEQRPFDPQPHHLHLLQQGISALIRTRDTCIHPHGYLERQDSAKEKIVCLDSDPRPASARSARSASARSEARGSSGDASAERFCSPVQSRPRNLPNISSGDGDMLTKPAYAAVAAAQRTLEQRASIVLIGTILDSLTTMTTSPSPSVSASVSSLTSTTTSSSALVSSSASFSPVSTFSLLAASSSSSSSSSTFPSSTSYSSFSLTGIQTVVPTYPPFTTASSHTSSSGGSRSMDSALAVKLSLGLGIPFAVLLILLCVLLLHRRQKRIAKARQVAHTYHPPPPPPPPPLHSHAPPQMAVVSQADLVRPQPSAGPAYAQASRDSRRDSAFGGLVPQTGNNEAGRSSSRRAYRTSSMYSSDLRPQALNLPSYNRDRVSSMNPTTARRSSAHMDDLRSNVAAAAPLPPPPPSPSPSPWPQQWRHSTSGPGGPLNSNPALDLARQGSLSSTNSTMSYTTNNNRQQQPPPPQSYFGPDASDQYLSPYAPGQWRPTQVSPIQEVSSPSAQHSDGHESRGSSSGQFTRLGSGPWPLPPPESPAYPYLTPYGRLDYWLPSPTEARSLGDSGSSVPDLQVSDSDAESQSLPIQHPPPLVVRPQHLAVNVHGGQGGMDEVSPLSSSGSGPPFPGRISVVSGLSPIDRRGVV